MLRVNQTTTAIGLQATATCETISHAHAL